ncbi:MAG: Uma2 family endonuclease [Acidobacteria bacterium]|nr:Uma2 family endonuclease [Acidobacteriota bacterium]
MPAKHWYTADLVVEISSPSTRIYDRKTKADTYRAMHVREMWLVYPDTKAVEVRYFESDRSATFKGDETIQSEVLPGIDLPVKRIFEETS